MAGTERYVRNSTADFLVFTKDSETDGIEVRVQDHEVWLTQKGIGQLFDVDRSVVAKHLRNIFAENELSESTTCAKFASSLQIMARPITTNSTPCPPLLLLATAPIPPVPHNSVNGQPKCWIHLPGRDMFWIRIGLLMGKSLMKILRPFGFRNTGNPRQRAPLLPENYGYLCYCRRLLGRQQNDQRLFCNRSE